MTTSMVADGVSLPRDRAPRNNVAVATTIADASLTEHEHLALERFVVALAGSLGHGLKAVWLFGSRARGEPPGEYSDIDLLVISEGGRRRDQRAVDAIAWDVAQEAGIDPTLLAPHVLSPARLENRRKIESFFIQEVDRDKIVLHGEA